MREDLVDEVEAINSIYGDGTLMPGDQAGVYVLHLPDHDTSLRVEFPEDYPAVPPAVLGTQSSGEHTRKGDAVHVLEIFREAIGRLFEPGQVCLYDVVEDVNGTLQESVGEESAEDLPLEGLETSFTTSKLSDPDSQTLDAPPWVLSDVVIELKSVFIARCAPVTSPDQAKTYLQHLLATDKKVAKATHNITAHRIKGVNGVSFQDCDDDGEMAAGGRVLHLMQLMDLWDVMVVVTRWYGGQKLGPARFGIINAVARDAFVKAGFVPDTESGATSSKKKGKRG